MFKKEVLITKSSLAKFDVYFFKQFTGTIPGDVPHRSSQRVQASRYKQFLHIPFVHDVDKDWGRLANSEHKHCDYQSSINLTFVNVTKSTRL